MLWMINYTHMLRNKTRFKKYLQSAKLIENLCYMKSLIERKEFPRYFKLCLETNFKTTLIAITESHLRPTTNLLSEQFNENLSSKISDSNPTINEMPKECFFNLQPKPNWTFQDFITILLKCFKLILISIHPKAQSWMRSHFLLIFQRWLVEIFSIKTLIKFQTNFYIQNFQKFYQNHTSNLYFDLKNNSDVFQNLKKHLLIDC